VRLGGRLRRARLESGSKTSAVALGALAVLVLVLVGYSLASQSPATTAEPSSPASMRATAVSREPPVSLWVGDSYTAGRGATGDDSARGQACLTAEAMGWICNLDAQGGTGFIDDGHDNLPTFQPAGQRIASDKREFVADIILIDIGRNDLDSPLAKVKVAIATYLSDVHRAYPRAQIVEIMPYFMRSGPPSPFQTDLAAFVQDELRKYDGHVIDPLGEGWMGGTYTSTMTIKDGHPNPVGHRYIAAHLAVDLRKFDLQLSNYN
jgi:hypothetical protein